MLVVFCARFPPREASINPIRTKVAQSAQLCLDSMLDSRRAFSESYSVLSALLMLVFSMLVFSSSATCQRACQIY